MKNNFKRITAVILCLSMLMALLGTNTLTGFAVEESEVNYNDFLRYSTLSKDGNYLYVESERAGRNENNEQIKGEAYFCACLIDNITVLKIPDEIDGRKVTAVLGLYVVSPVVTRIEYGKNVKRIQGHTGWGHSNNNPFEHGMLLSYRPDMLGGNAYDGKTKAPVTSIILNEGLEYIGKNSCTYYTSDTEKHNSRAEYSVKSLVLPSTLKTVETGSVHSRGIESIIIQSDAALDEMALPAASPFSSQRNSFKPHSIYYTGDCLNSNPFAFNYSPQSTGLEYSAESNGPGTYPPENYTIYKKADAKGFEKFETNEYEEYTTGYDVEYWKNPPVFEVKTYEDEWWSSIKEVEAITISAENIAADESIKANLCAEEKEYVSNTYTLATTGSSVKISATASPADAYDSRVFYISLNEDVAKADRETGEIEIVGDGTATIRCVAPSGVFSDCVINSERTLSVKIISAIQSFFASLSATISNFFSSIFGKLIRK